jgi:hypothetical protein
MPRPRKDSVEMNSTAKMKRRPSSATSGDKAPRGANQGRMCFSTALFVKVVHHLKLSEFIVRQCPCPRASPQELGTFS